MPYPYTFAAQINPIPLSYLDANFTQVGLSVATGEWVAFSTGGTSTAYAITPTTALTAYAAGVQYDVTFGITSGASPTLQISGLATPPNLVKENTDGTYTNIAAGDIPAGHTSPVRLISASQALVRILPPGKNLTQGLTVSGGPFISRGITDNATATALTLSGSGANSVTIANSATNPVLGTTAGSLSISASILAIAGLTVSGAAFTSRGITDNATVTALTLSGSGANSITIANSATNPTIGASAGNLNITSPTGATYVINSSSYSVLYISSAGVNTAYINFENATNGPLFGIQSTSLTTQYIGKQATGGHEFYTGSSFCQVKILHAASATNYITLIGSNGGNPTIGTSAGNLAISSAIVGAGLIQAMSGAATPAGGTAGYGFFLGSSSIGIYFGSGAPTIAAAQGSLYIRTDGGASTRLYSNNNGSTGWSAITSA
jgi:hypothetical protein